MIQALFDSKLLLLFLLAIGTIVIVLLSIFIVQIFKANDGIFQVIEGIAKAIEGIQKAIKLISTTDHEDKARDNQTTIEMQGRSNQSRVMIKEIRNMSAENNEEIKNLITKYNNTTEKTLLLIQKAMEQNLFQQKQNLVIIKLLTNISKEIQSSTNNTNVQVSKWGPENNAMAKRVLKEMGINATELLDKEVYGNQTLKQMIVNPSSLPTNPPQQ